MTVFENIPFNNIDEFSEWLNKYEEQAFTPWDCWFDKNYCNKCDVIVKGNNKYAWCELNGGKCKFFQNMNEIPYGKQVIKMWLESEDNYGI